MESANCLAMVFLSNKNRSSYGQRFLILTEGKSFERCVSAFEAHGEGRRLLCVRPDTLNVLKRRPNLRQSPSTSFEEAYTEFMRSNNFHEETYLEGARTAAAAMAPDHGRMWLRFRLEAGHDARHVLTGYGADIMGEACVLAFRAAQLNHLGAAILALIALAGAKLREGGSVIPPMIEAIRRGRRADLVDLAPLEFAAQTHLTVLQERLGLSEPVAYTHWVRQRARRIDRPLSRFFRKKVATC